MNRMTELNEFFCAKGRKKNYNSIGKAPSTYWMVAGYEQMAIQTQTVAS